MNLNLFFQIQISKNFEVEIALLILGEGLRWWEAELSDAANTPP